VRKKLLMVEKMLRRELSAITIEMLRVLREREGGRRSEKPQLHANERESR
jgi:hypothetical protein